MWSMVHHGIRGEEADRDSRFVQELCAGWEIPCRVYSYDVPALSAKWKLGEEETGRLVRRETFRLEGDKDREQGKKVRTALAHNQEDLAETMIHNLCRGTGLRGLCTMQAGSIRHYPSYSLISASSQIRDFPAGKRNLLYTGQYQSVG